MCVNELCSFLVCLSACLPACLSVMSVCLSVCLCAEIELYPPKLSVIDYNLTMISCVTRFNSNETEPSIYFLYNEIGITAGFNYATQTNNGLSPPRQVPCPPLYADNRRCTASLMYIVGNPTINGSSLMCTAVSNKTRQADSTTVTINVMTAEGKFASWHATTCAGYSLSQIPPTPPPLQRGKRNLVIIAQQFWNSSGQI